MPVALSSSIIAISTTAGTSALIERSLRGRNVYKIARDIRISRRKSLSATIKAWILSGYAEEFTRCVETAKALGRDPNPCVADPGLKLENFYSRMSKE